MAQKELEFLTQISSGDAAFDYDIRDLDLCVTPEGLRLYATSGVNGGVAIYEIAPAGATLIGVQAHGRDATLRSGQATVLEETGQLIQSGAGTGVSQYDISDAGDLSPSVWLSLPEQDAPVRLLASDPLSGERDVLITLDTKGALCSWRVDETGGEIASQGQFNHTGAQALAITDSGLLLVADAEIGGVISYRVDDSSGQLTFLSQIGTGDGLPVATPTALEVVTAHGQSWAVLAAGNSDSLTILSVAQDGGMQMVDHITDTLATRFGHITALEIIEVEGRVLVLAAGGDNGLSMLELLPDGRLLHRTAFEAAVGQDLQAINAITAVQVGHSLEIYATSQSGAGLTQLRYDLANFASSGSAGSGGDDLLSGAATLSGGAGDDVLVAGPGGAVLTGGTGADVFAPAELADPEHNQTWITDFTAGEDSIDMSAFIGLRSLADLVTQSRPGGIEIRYNDHRVVIDSDSGAALSLADIWPMGLGTPHRWLLDDSTDSGVYYGSDGDDLMSGDSLDEIFDGLSGNDRIEGAGGSDTLRGGEGHDSLLGGGGNDFLWGDQGDDRLTGGGGVDRLAGGDGSDTLLGGNRADVLFGGAGDDQLSGGKHADKLRGGLGQDTLRGNAGNDRLFGEGGRDSLIAGGGADVLFGNGGRDVLKGGGGADVLIGGAGRDILKGDGGADVFVFGRNHGKDIIRDFQPGWDQLDLSGAGVSYDDLNIGRQGGATVIATGFGEILLQGLYPVDLAPDDFIF